MNRNVYAVIAVLPALLLSLGGCGLEGERSESFDTGGARLTRVERVVDGDTVILAVPGLGPSSRLVGVDTPEVAEPGSPAECFGPQASDFAQRVLGPGRWVRYRVARDPVDPYGRSLIYLWLADGRFFNAMLLRGGYARVLTIVPNTRYALRFALLAKEASGAGRGLWGRC